jgi:hypothetical protein
MASQPAGYSSRLTTIGFENQPGADELFLSCALELDRSEGAGLPASGDDFGAQENRALQLGLITSHGKEAAKCGAAVPVILSLDSSAVSEHDRTTDRETEAESLRSVGDERLEH